MDELVTSATEGVGAKVQNFVNHAKATIVDDKLKPMVRSIYVHRCIHVHGAM
jgi:SPX domain protein involved in polyphosphate accumulation